MGHILIDLDKTLAVYNTGDYSIHGSTHIGPPIPESAAMVRGWISEGKDVRIFTARASEGSREINNAIEQWCLKHLGKILPITNCKTYESEAIYDDIAKQMIPNTGKFLQ